MKYFSVSVLLMLLVFNYAYGEVDFSKPDVVVSNAIEMLIDKQLSNLLDLTELAEKRRVQKSIDMYYGGDKSLIEKEISSIQSFKIVDVYYEGEFAVVSVDWIVKNIYQSKEGQKQYDANRKVLYLLKKFDDKWKIISKKVEI